MICYSSSKIEIISSLPLLFFLSHTLVLAASSPTQVLAELKATDHVFAADYDLEQKSRLTELQLKSHLLAQQRAMLSAASGAGAAGASMEVRVSARVSVCYY